MWNWKQCFAILLIGASLLAAPGAALAQAADTMIFAAASLKNALDAIAADWQKESGNKSKISYAASSTLAKQLEQSAPADLFISADLEWMDYVEQRQLIQTASRVNLLGNKLVLVGQKGGLKDGIMAIALVPGVDLLKPLAGGRLAMGTVNSVPAGKYGKAALEHLGVWDKVKSQIAEAESVRAALAYVSRGEAPLGIVYQTDAAADPAVAVLGTFPAASHPPIIYPAALTKDAKASAAALLSYLKSAKAKEHFEAQGFNLLVGAP